MGTGSITRTATVWKGRQIKHLSSPRDVHQAFTNMSLRKSVVLDNPTTVNYGELRADVVPVKIMSDFEIIARRPAMSHVIREGGRLYAEKRGLYAGVEALKKNREAALSLERAIYGDLFPVWQMGTVVRNERIAARLVTLNNKDA